jgi:hypothetical protein
MKLSRFLLTFWLVAVVAGLPGIPAARAQAAAQAAGPTPQVNILADGVDLAWSLPTPQSVLNSEGEEEIRISGFEQSSQPGDPRLPFTSVLVALPLNSKPVLEIKQTHTSSLALKGKLSANPAQTGLQNQPSTNLDVSANSPLVMEEIGTMRGVRLARITYNPLRQNGSQLDVVSQVQATLHFQAAAPQLVKSSDPLVRQVQSQVVNPGQVESSLQTQVTAQSLAPSAVTANATAILEVSKPGIYQVSSAQLAAAGFSLSGVDPLNLKLSHGAQEVAYEWTGSALRFYAQPSFSRWSASDTYLLTVGSAAGKKITARPADGSAVTPANANAEVIVADRTIYTPDCLDCGAIPLSHDGDRWVMTRLANPGKTFDWFEVVTPDVNPNQTATLTTWWIGWTDVAASPDHLINVSLNGTLLGGVSWDGKNAYQSTLQVPAGVLQSDSNIVTFDVPSIPGVVLDGVWLDAFKVNYILGGEALSGGTAFTGQGPDRHSYQVKLDNTTGLLAYDVSDASNPAALSDYTVNGTTLTLRDKSGVAAPSYQVVNAGGILTPTIRLKRSLTTAGVTGANYIVLAADGYTPALSNLIALRQSQGLSIVVENLQAIYDQFSLGRMDPQAIYAFLKSTYQTWNPVPQYVLLVGDGTVDPKNYRADSFATVLPANLKPVDPFSLEIASDNRYVTLDSDTDILPDMIVGRLPATTPSEAAAMVNKIVQYETAPVKGLWHGMTTFVSDNPDSGGDFALTSQNLAQLIPGSYIRPQMLLYGVNYADPTVMHTTLMNTWDQGSSLIVYTGHSAQFLWAQEQFLHVNDLPALTNGQKLPVVLELTCFTGNFAIASLSSLDESMVRQASGGAIATFGSASMGLSGDHESMAQGFLQSLTKDHPGQLGMAVNAAHMKIAALPANNQYLLDTYILFGDPATNVTLNFNPDHVVMIPMVKK